MSELSKRLAGLAHLPSNIARDVWPDGALLTCPRCSFEQPATTDQCAGYLQKGWPEHCGVTMTVEKRKLSR